MNELRGEFLQVAADLFENVLSKPPTPNVIELWKEHQYIRKVLDEVSTKQARFGDTDSQLSKTRSKKDVEAFLAWADQIGIKRYGITVAECDEVGGLGLLAEKDICERDRCLSVPRHAMITVELARKSAILKKLFENDVIVKNMANVGLALFLSAQRVKSDSKWTSYLNVLPSFYPTPLFYTMEELQVPALIPMLDMANHELVVGSEQLGEAVSYCAESDCAEVIASKNVRVGEWVSMFYGRRSCADHLLHNGFVPSGENPFDSYKLKISMGRSDKHFKEKQKLFTEMGFSENSNVYLYDVGIGSNPFHPSMEQFARIYVSDKPEKAISEPETLKKAVDFLKNRFALLERSYGPISEGTTLNEKNIARLKKAEIQILRNAKHHCESWEKRLAGVIRKADD